MKNTKLIILLSQPLTRFNSRRFGLNSNSKNFVKEFWYLLPLINFKLSQRYKAKEYRSINHRNIKVINSYFDLFKKIKNLKKGFYFLNWSTIFKFNLLLELTLKSKGGIKISRFFSHIPFKTNKLRTIKNIIIIDLKFFFSKLLSSIINFPINILRNILTVKPNYIFLESNYQSENLSNKEKKKAFFINSFDYSEYLRINKKLNKKKDLIFIDSEIENSYESQVLKLDRKYFDKKKYWNTMYNIFLLFEKKYKKKFKIAGHFRRSIKSKPINRKFYFDQTPNLIKDAKIVIAHNSTTALWSVLFNKPLILVNFENFNYLDVTNDDEFEWYKKELNLKMIKIDLNYNFKIKNNFFHKILNIDKNKYENFKNNYIKNKYANKSDLDGWRTMVSKLKKIN